MAIDKATVPDWCKAVTAIQPGVTGSKGASEFWGYDLANEIYGGDAGLEDSGLTAFAYLWRRFGPPALGSDDHKGLASYYIGTPNPGVLLWLGVSAAPLAYAVGFLATEDVRDPIYGPQREWIGKAEQWSREHGFGHAHGFYAAGEKQDVARMVADIGECPMPDASKWRDPSEPCHALNAAVAEALEELRRPVYVRDVPINVFGRMAGDEADEWEPAERSKYAGYGVPVEAMDALLKAES